MDRVGYMYRKGYTDDGWYIWMGRVIWKEMARYGLFLELGFMGKVWGTRFRNLEILCSLPTNERIFRLIRSYTNATLLGCKKVSHNDSN